MTTLAVDQLQKSLQIATLVAPAALYFLILGYLNTRRRPQLLSGASDSALLTAPFIPLLLGILFPLGASGAAGGLGLLLVFLVGWKALSGRRKSWVIYNLSTERVRNEIVAVLEGTARKKIRLRGSRVFAENGLVLEVDSFPLLRSVSIRLQSGDEDSWNDFSAALSDRIGTLETDPSPMAVTLLLVATAMIVAPLALIAPHTPQIVRLLGDLLP